MSRLIEDGGTSDLGMSAFFHMSNSPGVVVLCTTRFNEGGVHLTCVHLHSATCQNDLV